MPLTYVFCEWKRIIGCGFMRVGAEVRSKKKKEDEINFHKKKIKNFDETQAELLTNRFIQKITTQFVKHLKEEKTSVTDSIQVMSKVFGKS